MEVDVVVEGYDRANPAVGAEPCHRVPADGEQNNSHIELQCLGGPFGGAEAVAHDLIRHPVAVLDELPREECDAHDEPEEDDPPAPPLGAEKGLGLRDRLPGRIRRAIATAVEIAGGCRVSSRGQGPVL